MQWPVLLALPVLAALSTTDARAFVSMAFEGPFATICVALITGFVLLVAGLRGQLHRD